MSQSEEKPQNQAKSNRNNATFFQYPKKKWSYDDDVCTISATLNFFLTEIFYGHMVFQTWVHHPWQSVSKLWMPEDDLLPPLHKQRLCIKNFKALVTDHHTIKAISTSSLSFCKNNNHHEHCHWTVPTPIRFILNLQQQVPNQIGLFHLIIQCLSAAIGVWRSHGESGLTFLAVIHQWVHTQFELPYFLLFFSWPSLYYWFFRWDRMKRISFHTYSFLLTTCIINTKLTKEFHQGDSYSHLEHL